MSAIPKALAMANPKLVVASVATVASVITSKFAKDTVYDEVDDTDVDEVPRHPDNIIDFPRKEINIPWA